MVIGGGDEDAVAYLCPSVSRVQGVYEYLCRRTKPCHVCSVPLFLNGGDVDAPLHAAFLRKLSPQISDAVSSRLSESSCGCCPVTKRHGRTT